MARPRVEALSTVSPLISGQPSHVENSMRRLWTPYRTASAITIFLLSSTTATAASRARLSNWAINRVRSSSESGTAPAAPPGWRRPVQFRVVGHPVGGTADGTSKANESTKSRVASYPEATNMRLSRSEVYAGSSLRVTPW